MMTKGFGLPCVILAASLAGTAVLSLKMRGQNAALEQLRQKRQKLEELSLENRRLKSIVIDPIEMERLRRETAILLKLRNEFGQLSQPSDKSSPSAQNGIDKLLQERAELISEEQGLRNLSESATCISNLQAIVLAKTRWASENAAETGLPVTIEKLLAYLPGHTAPVCPAGGHYSTAVAAWAAKASNA